MKSKKTALFSFLLTCTILGYAQTSVVVEGNVEIKDDPATAAAAEGGLKVNGSLIVSDAEGDAVLAPGRNSIAIGQSRALGDYSIAIGNDNNWAWARAKNGIAVGTYARAGENFDNVYSFAYGNNAYAQGSHSLAFGNWSHAATLYSAAIGYKAYAAGYISIAMGYDVSVNGYMPLGIGNLVVVNGDSAFAFGARVNALHHGTMVVGFESTATGRDSMIFGRNVTAKNYKETVMGVWNDPSEYPASMSYWIPSDPLFVIGNGESEEKKSNALVVFKNGDTKINGDLTAKKMTVETITMNKPTGGISMGEFALSE